MNIEITFKSKAMSIRAIALRKHKEDIEKKIEELKEELEYVTEDLELAYQMTDRPKDFKLIQKEEGFDV